MITMTKLLLYLILQKKFFLKHSLITLKKSTSYMILIILSLFPIWLILGNVMMIILMGLGF